MLSSNDVADANLRIILPVTLRALVLLLALELEHENLVRPVLCGNGRVHTYIARAFAEQQIARRVACVLEQRDNFTERNFRSDFGGQFGNPNHIARCDAKLFSAGFDNCMDWEMNLAWKNQIGCSGAHFNA